MFKPLIALMSTLTLWLLAANATAATLPRMDLEELVVRSDAVVVAQVETITTELDARGRVVSTITLTVRETLKGPARRTVAIRQLGGYHGDVGTRVPGMPVFQIADRGVLFLSGNVAQHPASVTGLAQGFFRVALGPDSATEFAIPQVNNLNLVVRDRAQTAATTSQLRSVAPAELHQQAHDLNTFKARIRTIVDETQPEEPR
ncbi:hypothetical protein EA187_11360 [Lujinxingia sediminis]|uniref:Uncharacterized protein n=1 Tax=Lujinxingia sediminis TaxID=2480984 RepID=A0ABY0CSR7_9DELT|nr:hypothetical protein [Lujinxingia sediminis]RVU44139.1 hypothetical protein EA187_11360 [Lujinxingia sediminis]